jgi:hypothetical protein
MLADSKLRYDDVYISKVCAFCMPGVNQPGIRKREVTCKVQQLN